MLPTQRTLQWYRKQGVVIGITERWNQHSRTRHDLFGFIDLVAVYGNSIIGIQCTSASHVTHRIEKIRTECAAAARAWLRAGGVIQVIGWRKLVKRNQDGSKSKVKRWEPRIEHVTEAMLSGELERATA